MNDRPAVITGASSGIGEATALYLAGRGIPVVAIARRDDRLEQLAAQHEGIHGLTVDLRDEFAVEQAFAAIEERWGPVGTLVNSAGVGAGSSLLEGTLAEWRATLEVNVLALSQCTQLAVDQMRRHDDRGQIVHISSMSGHRTVTGAGMYAASKFAVQALAEGLRLELRQQGSQIRVATISPGTVATRFALEPDEPDRSAPWPLLQAEDVAASVWHVVSAPPHVHIGDIQMRPTGQKI